MIVVFILPLLQYDIISYSVSWNSLRLPLTSRSATLNVERRNFAFSLIYKGGNIHIYTLVLGKKRK